MGTKKPTSIRLSEEGKHIRKLLAKKLGLSESAVLELALRRLAEMEGIRSDENHTRVQDRAGLE